jgi:tetratricopeptide (TPR) repeat protein
MPENSPELAARIETLRASHAENPARFFMPLASAYREGGEVAKAEELLRENLKRHPGYLSAHVLLGRCLADRGANAEARNEFQYVLSVDPQNLIALRTLGEMAAASGEAGEARRWFGELLSVDPMNAEARQSLAALDAAPAAALAEAGGDGDGFGMVEPGAGGAPAADHPAAHADPGSWGEVSLDAHPSFSAGDAPAPGEPPAPTFEALDFGAVDLSTPVDAPVEEASPPAGSAADDFALADAAPAPAEPSAGSVDDGQDEVEAAGVEPLELEAFYDADAAPEEQTPAAHAEEHDEHEEVVTETIAELYARQGFPERAAGVYRVLIGRRGEEPALVRRLQELEAQIGAAGGGDEERFEPVDLPGAADEAAAAPVDESPSWLATVDAVAASDAPSAAAPAFDEGPIDFQPDEPQPSAEPEPEPIATLEEPAAAAATTGDAFADSFANGFSGIAAEPERRAWEAPRVEETESAAEPAAAEAFAAMEPEDVVAAAEPAVPAGEQPRSGVRESIAAYLSGILSWRPGAGAQAPASDAAHPSDAAAPASDDVAAPPPAHPWDEETLGASDEQPPIDEPWIAGADASPDVPPADEPWTAAPAEPVADEPWSAPAVDAEPSADEPSPDEPWSAPAVNAELSADEPWSAPAADAEPWAAEGEGDDAGEELPWLSQDAETGGAADAAPAEEAMPWETSFDLSPEVPETGPGERPAPRQEPTVEPSGGFSFEDFFSEPAAPEQSAAAPEPALEPLPELAPPPSAAQSAAPPAAAEGGEEDEDLESFQAWLQSLKR